MKIGFSFAAWLVLTLTLPGAVRAQTCGNGAREPPEQCDDGNNVNMDGCSATCTFEQTQRINQLKMQSNTNVVCTANAVGGAFASFALSSLQTSLDASVMDGTTSVLIHFINLTDLSGTAQSNVGLGLVNAENPVSRTGYNGNNDLDWWYVPDPAELDTSRVPTNLMNANISARLLTAYPGAFGLRTIFGGTPATLQFSSLRIQVPIGTSSTPTAFGGTTTSGHLPSENLDPALTSFQTGGGPTDTQTDLCGNISAASLANIPLPAAFAAGGLTDCAQNYSLANSMLDMLVGGCTVIVPAVYPTQPDQADPNAPTAGAGAPYKLSASSANKIIDTCRDMNNAVVPLATCLDAAAYSSFFKFSTDRVIVRDRYDTIFANGFE